MYVIFYCNDDWCCLVLKESNTFIAGLNLSIKHFEHFRIPCQNTYKSVPDNPPCSEDKNLPRKATLNKHCEILVSCSDKERNCIQALGTACKLMELHATHGTACKLMELHASSCNCMQAHGTACKLMLLHASSYNCMQAHIKTACKLI